MQYNEGKLGGFVTIDKGKIHHWWRMLRKVKTWQLLLLFLLALGGSVLLLRQNSLGMVERRNLVKQADEEQGDVDSRLRQLQQYISSHMNTSMGDKGVYLEKSYQRAYDAALQSAVQGSPANLAAYQSADIECQNMYSKADDYEAYIQCVIDKINNNRTNTDPLATLNAPSVDLFRYNFVPPVWSVDWAGFAVLMTFLLAIILLNRIVIYWVLYLLLRRRAH